MCKAGASVKKIPLYQVRTLIFLLIYSHSLFSTHLTNHFLSLSATICSTLQILLETKHLMLPVPAFNVINGGSHAGNKLAMQVNNELFLLLSICLVSEEFLLVSYGFCLSNCLSAFRNSWFFQLVGAASFKGAMKMGVEVYLWRLNWNSFSSFVWSSCIFWRFCFILL